MGIKRKAWWMENVFKPGGSTSTRFPATANVTVDGIENRIILAVPTSNK
jgi:hypothetical protein